MLKKIILLTAALCLFIVSNLTLCCRAELDGTVLEGFYSPQTLRCAEETARGAAEEILRREGRLESAVQAAFGCHIGEGR